MFKRVCKGNVVGHEVVAPGVDYINTDLHD